MKKIYSIVMLVLSLILVSACNNFSNEVRIKPSPTYDTNIQIDFEYKESEIPQPHSDKWYKANYGKAIAVAIKNNKIIAVDGVESSYSNNLEVEQGTIMGVDNGEWGGGVKFIPKKGNEYKLIDENFRGFYVVGEKKYALTGLSHLSLDWGNIYQLKYSSKKWKAKKVIDLGSCPKTFLLKDEKLYLVTDTTLCVIEDGKISENLVKEAFWRSLYPNSIVFANESLYIGMRGGIFSYNLNSKKETWYEVISS